jgi:hypothetical protein
VSFLSQVEWDGFGRYAETPPDRQVLERFFFLDDADRELVAEHRGAHSQLGFAVQLVTVRHVGRFLANPLDVPTPVVDYLGAPSSATCSATARKSSPRTATSSTSPRQTD